MAVRPFGRLGVEGFAVRAKLWDRPRDLGSTAACRLQRAFPSQLGIGGFWLSPRGRCLG